MNYRIIATHDTVGNDDIYLSDAITKTVSDEIAENLESCVIRLHEIADSGNANGIEVIYPSRHGNYHSAFYAPSHPFAVVEFVFDEIDQWAEQERTRINNINTPESHASLFQDDNDELPF